MKEKITCKNMNPCTNKPVKWLLVSSLLFSTLVPAQTIYKKFTSLSFSEADYAAINKNVGINKTIPALYEKQILIALTFFPELSDTHIKFRVKPANGPLSARPTWMSIMKSKGFRKYIITISDITIPVLMPLLLKNMDFNAQVGVIGHELSHAADFDSKSSFRLLQIGIENLFQKYLDRLESGTDRICIAHGLGYQFLSWSSFVRETLQQ